MDIFDRATVDPKLANSRSRNGKKQTVHGKNYPLEWTHTVVYTTVLCVPYINVALYMCTQFHIVCAIDVLLG